MSKLWKKGLCVLAMLLALGVSKETKAAVSDEEFIKGMDLSSLEAVEDAGGVFYDENNQPVSDILSYVKSKGVNYVRLRIWNNPTTSFDAGDYCNKAHTIEMAQRIKASGMKFLLDFHYSDTWADPSYQSKPAAWENLSYSELKQAVYDYTSEVLTDLAAVGAYPDMVQVGNEISGGMLWQDGYIDNLDNLAGLLNSGISAVRATTPSGQATKIMIHLAEGGDTERFEYFFDNMTSRGVTDFDVIGMSYYPYWHGSPQALKDNMNNASSRYGKEVVVAELSYPYTYEDADSQENLIGVPETTAGGLTASVANQKKMIETVFNTVANVDNSKGLGAFYWEPLWLAVDGVGVTQGEGNEWDNQILFDANHKVLDSINAFSYTPSSAAANNGKDVIVYNPDDVVIEIGSTNDVNSVLPDKVKVLQFNGTLKEMPVVWQTNGVSLTSTGNYTLSGTVTGLSTIAGDLVDAPKVNLTVQHNLLTNASFEDPYDTQNWMIERTKGDAGTLTIWDNSTPHTGSGSFQYWDDKDFAINLYQSVTVQPGHTYDFSAWAQGTAENMDFNNSYFYVSYEKNGKTVELGTKELETTYYNNWKKHEISNLTVPSGVTSVKVGVRLAGAAEGYGTIDDMVLVDKNEN